MWNILIAEDDLDICQNMTSDLQNVANLTVVHNGEDALKAYKVAKSKNSPYDFILLDVTMPIMDGFEVLKTIREMEENDDDPSAEEIFVIMLTSYGDSLMDKINMGWDDFITKPVDAAKLISHLERLKPKATV